jgi:hypothetical protein
MNQSPSFSRIAVTDDSGRADERDPDLGNGPERAFGVHAFRRPTDSASAAPASADWPRRSRRVGYQEATRLRRAQLGGGSCKPLLGGALTSARLHARPKLGPPMRSRHRVPDEANVQAV